MHSHELLLVVRADICTCNLGALPYVIAPVICYARVIALSGFCFGSTHVLRVLELGDSRFVGGIPCSSEFLCCSWPPVWKCCTP